VLCYSSPVAESEFCEALKEEKFLLSGPSLVVEDEIQVLDDLIFSVAIIILAVLSSLREANRTYVLVGLLQ